MYYVYVDWTTDSESYPFYVGRGNIRRTTRTNRNMYHRRIAQKHGLRREIVIGPVDRELSNLEEVRLIAELNTFNGDNPKGANFTRGGDGSTGHKVTMTDEWRAKISATLTGKIQPEETNIKRSIAQLGKKKPRKHEFTQEERDRIYGHRRGHDHVSPEKRREMADKLKGRKRIFSEEHKQHLREAALRRHGQVGSNPAASSSS